MKRLVCLFLFGTFIKAVAGEADLSPDPISSATLLEIETLIDNSYKSFTAELNASALNPIERATCIEHWQQEQEPLFSQARDARATVMKQPNGESRGNPAAGTPAALETPTDPIQADILEIESGILDFQKSLDTSQITPEQRVNQVEQFLLINRGALAELENLKRHAAIKIRKRGPKRRVKILAT